MRKIFGIIIILPFVITVKKHGNRIMRVLLSFILIGSLLITPSVILAETFLSDDFNGTIVNSDRWHIPTWKGTGDGTYVGRTQFRCVPSPLPEAENSNAKILLETYNPTAKTPGDSFYGTDLISNQLFSLGKGIRIKVRAKMNTSKRGIVGGIFLYALKEGSETLHDEVDFELITNIPDKVQTNIYSNEPLGEGYPILSSYNSGSITDYHTYEIQWQPNRVSWFVDGSLVRSETKNVPTGPMYFHLNIWAPTKEGWEQAYDADLQPDGDPKKNQEYWMSVDSICIQSFIPDSGESNLAPILLPLLLGENQ